jgi:hypothetical protein
MKLSAIHPTSTTTTTTTTSGNYEPPMCGNSHCPNSAVKDTSTLYDGRCYVKKYIDKYENQTTCNSRLSYDEVSSEQASNHLELKIEEANLSGNSYTPHSIRVRYDTSPAISTTIQHQDYSVIAPSSACVKSSDVTTLTTVTVTTPSPAAHHHSPPTTTSHMTTVVNEKKLKSSTVGNFGQVDKYELSSTVMDSLEANLNKSYTDQLTESAIYPPQLSASSKQQSRAHHEYAEKATPRTSPPPQQASSSSNISPQK